MFGKKIPSMIQQGQIYFLTLKGIRYRDLVHVIKVYIMV